MTAAFDVLRHEEGQGLTEYAPILVLVALVVMAGRSRGETSGNRQKGGGKKC